MESGTGEGVNATPSPNWNYYPGQDGIPFRTEMGAVPSYKRDDPTRRQPQRIAEMHVRQFNLKSREEAMELERVLNACARGTSCLSQKEIQYDSTIKGWRVFLIWGDYFLEDPLEAAVRHENRKNFS